MTTRAPGSTTRSDLLPTSPEGDFAAGRVALIDADGRVVGRGMVGRVTGIAGFTAGKRYYIDTPASGTAPNLTAVPDPVPDGFPGTNIWNANRRFYLAGECFADGAELYFIHYSDAAVAVTDVAGVYRLDIASFPYNTDLIAGGQLARLLQVTGQTAAITKLYADGDAGESTTAAPSPIIKDIGGVNKGVYIREQPYGTYDLRYVPGWPEQLGGEMLMQFQMMANEPSNILPTIFFGGSGGPTTGTLGKHWGVQGYAGNMVLHRINTDGATITADTDLGSGTTGVTWTANEFWNLRVKVEGSTKKVYARAWRAADPEPSIWNINGTVVNDLVAGKWGYRFKNNIVRVVRLAYSEDGVTATYA